MIREFLKEINGINFIDIGSSGYLNAKWKNLEPYINLIGFDPNVIECERMSALPHHFKSLKYLPFALAGSIDSHTLYKTKNIYCYSLLEPNTDWLKRFSFADYFEVEGKEIVSTKKLNEIKELQEADVDILKIDTQGLELPILSNAGNILEKCFFVETETGFVQNYIGETTYAEIDIFMRENGFLLFDINTDHRVARSNLFKEVATGAEQILWCESTWMKDYVTLINKGEIKAADLSREKALKILIICCLQNCIDYGFELAQLFKELKIIDGSELSSLAMKENWLLVPEEKPNNKSSFINALLRLLPFKLRKEISVQAQIAEKQKHLFKG